MNPRSHIARLPGGRLLPWLLLWVAAPAPLYLWALIAWWLGRH